MSVNQRLREFVEVNKISPPDLYRSIGASRMEYSSWVTLNKAMSLSRVQSLLLAYPELNARWFLLGLGKMLEDSSPIQNQVIIDKKQWEEQQNQKEIIDLLKEQNLNLKERITDLRTIIEAKQALLEEQIKTLNTLNAQLKATSND